MNPTLKKILRIIFYGIIFFVAEYFWDTENVIDPIRITYSYPLMVFVSVIRGPFVGGMAIALGRALLQIGQDQFVWQPVLISAVNCAWIGFGMREVDIQNGFFERNDVALFNKIQIISNVVCWIILYPGLNYFIYHASLSAEFWDGFWQALGNILSNLVATTILLALYARSRISAANFYRN